MKIIHTADWHLGHRLGRQDRTEDLKRAIDRVAGVCLDEKADVLLVCGDLFHDVSRTDVLREAVTHLGRAFRPFFAAGGTVLAITGNHDKEHLVQILRQVMDLAAPADLQLGGELARGRFHLFLGPTFFRLGDREGPAVQFVMMPWPTPSRYLDEQGQNFHNAEERNRALRLAFGRRLNSILNHAAYDKTLPTVLAAHLITQGAQVRDGYALSEADAMVLDDGELPTALAYVALGDVHKPQCLLGLPHVRYAGSIEKLDLGEAGDEKGVVAVEIAGPGRTEPRWIPLETTPVYRVVVSDPPADLPGLADQYPDRERALASLEITYQPGRDDLNDILAELDRLFPRWYDRKWSAAETEAAAGAGAAPAPAADPERVGQTVRQYLTEQLAGHQDWDELAALAESLLVEASDEAGGRTSLRQGATAEPTAGLTPQAPPEAIEAGGAV